MMRKCIYARFFEIRFKGYMLVLCGRKNVRFKTIPLAVDLAHLDEGQKTLDLALSLMGENTEIILL